MRVFQNSERGILIGTELCLRVGDYVIDFDDSLLTTPGSTFGDRLVNVMVWLRQCLKDDQGRADVTLAGSPPGTLCQTEDALVRVKLCVSLDGEQSTKCVEEEYLSEILKWQSRIETKSYGGELPHTSRSRYVHALIIFKAGGKIEFRDIYQRPRSRTFWQVLTGAKRVVEEFLAVTVFSYDGRRVRQEDLPPRKIGETNLPTSSGREMSLKAACFFSGGLFGLLTLIVLGTVHVSVFWWILTCAVFAAGSTRQWMVDPSELKSSVTRWCWASFGAFLGAFVPYIGYCLTHVAQ